MGFWVARTRNGESSGKLASPMVTVRSCIASSSADCTLAGDRLISSARMMLAKMGPLRVLNSDCRGSYTRVPMRSAGSRSGVNWMRRNVVATASARVRTVIVFARPGTPSISTCPSASRPTSSRSIMVRWPTMTRPTASSSRSTKALSAWMRC